MKEAHSFGRLDEELWFAKLILRFINVHPSQYPLHTLFLVTGPARPRFFRENRVSVQKLGERPSVGEASPAHSDIFLQTQIFHLEKISWYYRYLLIHAACMYQKYQIWIQFFR